MIGIYYRVSTERQEFTSQKNEIAKYLAKLGNPKHVIYEEKISSRKNRPEFNRMLKDANNGTITEIITYAFDRFGRDGKQSLLDLYALESNGIKVSFASQSYLNEVGDDDLRMVLSSLAAYQAKKERDHISSRIKSGLAAARAKGVKLGRRCVDNDIKIAVVLDLKQGLKIAQIAQKYSISDRTVQRIKQRNEKLA